MRNQVGQMGRPNGSPLHCLISPPRFHFALFNFPSAIPYPVLFSALSVPSAVTRSPRHLPLDSMRTYVLQWPHNIGTELYTAPDQIKSSKQHLRAALLWADSFKLIAGCTKLLASPGKLNMWGFVRGIQFWGNYSST
jgi:hypothetical protein